MTEATTFLRIFRTRNVANWDRALRAVPALLIAYLAWTGALTGMLLWGLGVASAMLLITSLTGSCSIYYVLGFSTCPLSGKPHR